MLPVTNRRRSLHLSVHCLAKKHSPSARRPNPTPKETAENWRSHRIAPPWRSKTSGVWFLLVFETNSARWTGADMSRANTRADMNRGPCQSGPSFFGSWGAAQTGAFADADLPGRTPLFRIPAGHRCPRSETKQVTKMRRP